MIAIGPPLALPAVVQANRAAASGSAPVTPAATPGEQRLGIVKNPNGGGYIYRWVNVVSGQVLWQSMAAGEPGQVLSILA